MNTLTKKFGCTLCPKNCCVDRTVQLGACGVSKKLRVAKASLHMWEEPIISGVNGSGTVFFSGCNLSCVYCQNYHISQECFGKELSPQQLANIFTNLYERGAHNINLVSPMHYVDGIKEALEYKRPYNVPIVYNSNGYEMVKTLKKLENLIDVYLPDIKYIDEEISLKYSGVDNYFDIAVTAISEMIRQVGDVFIEDGLIKRGVVIRHLILPRLYTHSIRILDYIKEHFGSSVIVSLMCQYIPVYQASKFPEINRKITSYEYNKVLTHFEKLGLSGYYQQKDSASQEFIPKFDLEGV